MKRIDTTYEPDNLNTVTTITSSKSVRPYSVKIITLDMLKNALYNIERNERIMAKKHQPVIERQWSNDNSLEPLFHKQAGGF